MSTIATSDGARMKMCKAIDSTLVQKWVTSLGESARRGSAWLAPDHHHHSMRTRSLVSHAPIPMSCEARRGPGKVARIAWSIYFPWMMRARAALMRGDCPARLPRFWKWNFRVLVSRLALACLTALSVCATSLEALIPDAHDSDAIHYVASASSASDIPSAEASFPLHRPVPPGDEHPIHADHCSHGHYFGPEPIYDLARPGIVRLTAAQWFAGSPPRLAREPQHRPPIA